MTRYTIVKIFAIRTKNKLMPHILMHCRAIGKITNQSIYMRTPFIFPYGTMIEWVTIFKPEKESLYSFNYDFEHIFFILSSTSIGLFYFFFSCHSYFFIITTYITKHNFHHQNCRIHNLVSNTNHASNCHFQL